MKKHTQALKMKTLVDRSGVPKSTILYYLKEGLLPEPHRSGPNTALYDPVCLPLLTFIRQMQERQRLSIREIGRIIRSWESYDEVHARLALREMVFDPGLSPAPAAPLPLSLTREDLCRESGLPPDALQDLEEAGMIQPLIPGQYDAADLQLAKMFAWSAGFGLNPTDLAFYPRLAKQWVAEEFKLRGNLNQGLNHQEDVACTRQMLQAARICRSYYLERAFQQTVAGMKDLGQPQLPITEED